MSIWEHAKVSGLRPSKKRNYWQSWCRKCGAATARIRNAKREWVVYDWPAEKKRQRTIHRCQPKPTTLVTKTILRKNKNNDKRRE